VGFHRYAVENLNDVSSDTLLEREVEEFDPPSEVHEKKYSSVYMIFWQAIAMLVINIVACL